MEYSEVQKWFMRFIIGWIEAVEASVGMDTIRDPYTKKKMSTLVFKQKVARMHEEGTNDESAANILNHLLHERWIEMKVDGYDHFFLEIDCKHTFDIA